MRITFRVLFAFLFTGILLSASAYYCSCRSKYGTGADALHKNVPGLSSVELSRLQEKANALKRFVALHSYNNEVCFLADMSLSSGRNRLFVFSLHGDSVMLRGLVAHGSCGNSFRENPSFSNEVNSGCSSLGKYRIGNAYQGNFGLAYKLYGLDSSNRNAWQRNIVLHSYSCVPDQEADPAPICNSLGCAMVSKGFLAQLQRIIDQSKKPVILWIFN